MERNEACHYRSLNQGFDMGLQFFESLNVLFQFAKLFPDQPCVHLCFSVGPVFEPFGKVSVLDILKPLDVVVFGNRFDLEFYRQSFRP